MSYSIRKVDGDWQLTNTISGEILLSKPLLMDVVEWKNAALAQEELERLNQCRADGVLAAFRHVRDTDSLPDKPVGCPHYLNIKEARAWRSAFMGHIRTIKFFKVMDEGEALCS